MVFLLVQCDLNDKGAFSQDMLQFEYAKKKQNSFNLGQPSSKFSSKYKQSQQLASLQFL